MELVAREANVSKGGLLHHFPKALLHNSVYWRDDAVIEFSVKRSRA
ncbi:TetR family transcriptional regulator [Komagataeibacter europaeus]|nr:TetR family transcriptional regulator [Komagataeibacter europaeus]